MMVGNSFSVCKLCLTCAETVASTRVNGSQGIVTTTVSGQPVTSAHCDRCRLLSHVLITPTCWLWIGTTYVVDGKATYGQGYLNGYRTGAHRVSYLIHVGPVPAGLDVMHECDIKLCVRPEHLLPGTRKQNLADARARRGEWSLYGENHGRAKLTQAQVEDIRVALAIGTYGVKARLGRQYGVSATAISMIARGKRWNVTRPEPAEAAA